MEENNFEFLDKVLNKEEFIKILESEGLDKDDQEKEWQKIRAIFSLNYFEELLKFLDDDQKEEVGVPSEIEFDALLIQEYLEKTLKYIEEQKLNLDFSSCVKKAVTNTQKIYYESLKGVNNE